jgi:hypothetical protein
MALREWLGKHYSVLSEGIRATLYEKNLERGLTPHEAMNSPRFGVHKYTTTYTRQSPVARFIRSTPIAPWATYALQRLGITARNLKYHPVRAASSIALAEAFRRLFEIGNDDVTEEEQAGARAATETAFGSPFTAVTGRREDGSIRTVDTGPFIPLDAPYRGPRLSLDDQGAETARWILESAFGPLGPAPATALQLWTGRDERGREILDWKDKLRVVAEQSAHPYFPGVPFAPFIPKGRQAATISNAFQGKAPSQTRLPQTPAEGLADALMYLRFRAYDPDLAMMSLSRQADRARDKARRRRDRDIETDPAEAEAAQERFEAERDAINAARDLRMAPHDAILGVRGGSLKQSPKELENLFK